MSLRITPAAKLLAALGLAASTLAAQPAPAASATATPPAPRTSAASFKEAFTEGKLSANARVRYEFVEQDTLQNADSLTARLRLGYTTREYQGFQAMLEGEAVSQLAGDAYDGTGSFPLPPAATIADPEHYEINQAWLAYRYDTLRATLGRQRVVLDNARFVGDVGWRQNQQTFDAVLLQDKSFKHTTLTYAYLDRINRVFDDSAPQYDWASDSHLVHASFAGLPFGTLAAYGYLLDFDETNQGAFNNSSQTYGASFSGSRPVTEDWKALYRLEYATQSDHGSSALDYRANYYAAELGASCQGHSLSFNYEVLGSDESRVGTGFKTPLATLHSHNGWADKFLATPDAGLEDINLKAVAKLPADLTLLARYHWFSAEDVSVRYGTELDLQLTYQYDSRLSFSAKTAFYEASSSFLGPISQDTDKYWLQAEFVY